MRSLIRAAALGLLASANVLARGAPDWMHALVAAPLPAHEDTDRAVLLYSERVLTMRADGRLKTRTRKAWRILSHEGDQLGRVLIYFDGARRITDIHGWSIPPSGEDFEVKEKDMPEIGLPGIINGTLVSDARAKFMQLPAAVPGSVIGYEVEQDKEPYLLNDEWDPQEDLPVREARYVLQLPAGWTYSEAWINKPAAAPVSAALGNGQWQWVLTDLPAVRIEERMPPWKGVAQRLVVSLTQTGGQSSGWNSWQGLGDWTRMLLGNRRDPSPEIRAEVATLTSAEPTPIGRIRTLARFVQSDIRYVAIELGIGGYQPHAAADVFAHRYGDCKDKVTLLGSMLQQIGVESYPVIINTVRGTVSPGMPANLDFDHEIIAIRLPAGSEDASLLASVTHPQLGRLLFFDPTDTLTPFGRLSGPLQANYGLLVAPGAADLIALPQLTAETSGVRRTATMQLDASGTLQGEVVETILGDVANTERRRLNAMPLDIDRIRPVEARLTGSLSSFKILKAAVGNLDAYERPFEWHYSLEAEHYARATGGLLLLRPRVLGSFAGLLKVDEERSQPIEFYGPERDTDEIVIGLPDGYRADELPPAIDADVGFAAYSSRTELAGGKLTLRRSFEIRKLSVPAAQADDMRKLYRSISDDERRTIVLEKSQP